MAMSLIGRAKARNPIRLQTQSGSPDGQRDEYDGSLKFPRQLVISRWGSSPVLEAGKRTLDDVSTLVGFLVEWMEALTGWVLLDHRRCVAVRQE